MRLLLLIFGLLFIELLELHWGIDLKIKPGALMIFLFSWSLILDIIKK